MVRYSTVTKQAASSCSLQKWQKPSPLPHRRQQAAASPSSFSLQSYPHSTSFQLVLVRCLVTVSRCTCQPVQHPSFRRIAMQLQVLRSCSLCLSDANLVLMF